MGAKNAKGTSNLDISKNIYVDKESEKSKKISRNESEISVGSDKDNFQKNDDELVKKLEEKTRSINSILDFLDDNFSNIHSSKGNEYIKKDIALFKKTYEPYKNLKRFSIPVIGCISSGKSTILNYLLKLKKTLEMKNQITTKCVCIIRHQKGYKKPKIYEVNLKSRNYGMYNFEKGKEICENVEKVVSDRNKLIKDNKVGNDYEKYFLIIEYEIPFFKGEMEKYADIFEFMDVPGLNEAIDSKTKNQNETENTIVNNFYFSRIFPLIKNNIKFSLFIFSQDNYANSNTMEILMAYVFQEKKKKKKETESNSEKKNFWRNKI